MRQRKDPGIRREKFIQAAQALFLERGYENVTVREVLDAVGERTSSPSVFYYYFRSKDDLYQACLKAAAGQYLAAMREAFREELAPMQQLFALAKALEESLAAYGRLLSAEGAETSVPDRLVILDLRDQVTREIAELWIPLLLRLGVPQGEAASLSRFLAGGIGELVYAFLLSKDSGEEARHQVMRAISDLTLRILPLSEEERQEDSTSGEEKERERII